MNVNALWRIVIERGFVWRFGFNFLTSGLYGAYCFPQAGHCRSSTHFPCKYKEQEVLVHFLVTPVLLPYSVIWLA